MWLTHKSWRMPVTIVLRRCCIIIFPSFSYSLQPRMAAAAISSPAQASKRSPIISLIT